jgi:anti-anti-sigma factor
MDITRDITTGGPVLVLHGDFDVRSTPEVRAAIYDLLGGGEVEVVVDLGEVDNIDVTALRVLAVATRQAWLTGHHLTVRNCGPSVRRMMHLTRLARAIEVERTAVSA